VVTFLTVIPIWHFNCVYLYFNVVKSVKWCNCIQYDDVLGTKLQKYLYWNLKWQFWMVASYWPSFNNCLLKMMFLNNFCCNIGTQLNQNRIGKDNTNLLYCLQWQATCFLFDYLFHGIIFLILNWLKKHLNVLHSSIVLNFF